MSLYPYAKRFPVVREFPQLGRSREEVLAEIDVMSEVEDSPYHEGRISGSIYSGDEVHYAFLNEVFGHYSHANVLQRDMYPSATRFEGEIIAMTGDMLHSPGAEAGGPFGVLTSGGTESLMNPLLVYREWGRERGITQFEIAKAEAILRSVRAWVYEITDEIWDKSVRDVEITMHDRAMLRMACAHAAFEGARATDIAYTLGGGSSIYETSVLQRCMRDVHATTQHVMHALPNYEVAGKVMLGLDPGTPMV